MGRVGHSSLCTSNAFYDRSLLDWRKAQKTKASFGGTGGVKMQVGNLVKFKNNDMIGLVVKIMTLEDRRAPPWYRILWADGHIGNRSPNELEIISESR